MENKGTNGKVQRGEIYLYDFGNNGGSIQNGVRPALVVQCDEGNAASSTTIIAAMTSIIKKQYLPSHIILGDRFGLKEPSMVMLEQLKTVNQSDLIEYIGKIDDEHYMKKINKPKDEWQIIPNTQPAIIDEDTWKRVQELREHRIRPTATGRTSLFSGKAFCADCGSKLHFCAAKSLNANQEYYRCSNYKSGRGSCQIHFIRNVVLEKIVLEAINSLADFVRCYEPVFLYLMVQKDIVSKRTETSKLKTAIESGKRRIQDLDKLIERIYEDQVLGNISAERYARMSVNYENEQRTLINKVAEDEKKLACIEQTSLDLKTLLKVLRSSTSFDELTPTLVNSLIRRIEVHNNDKSSGHCYVKVDIYFTAIGLIDIPTEDEIKSLMAKIKANPQEYRLTA